jgi:hypothetical protein
MGDRFLQITSALLVTPARTESQTEKHGCACYRSLESIGGGESPVNMGFQAVVPCLPRRRSAPASAASRSEAVAWQLRPGSGPAAPSEHPGLPRLAEPSSRPTPRQRLPQMQRRSGCTAGDGQSDRSDRLLGTACPTCRSPPLARGTPTGWRNAAIRFGPLVGPESDGSVWITLWILWIQTS